MKKGCKICEYTGDDACVPIGSQESFSADQVRASCGRREGLRQSDDSHLAPPPGITGPAVDFTI